MLFFTIENLLGIMPMWVRIPPLVHGINSFYRTKDNSINLKPVSLNPIKVTDHWVIP